MHDAADTLATFDRCRARGLDARRAGQWDAARVYLLEAARAMADLAKQARTDDLRDARRQTAEKLLDLARDCEAAAREKRRPGGRSPSVSRGGRGGTGGEASASAEGDDAPPSADRFVVRERPEVTFDDVAGLEGVKDDVRLKMLYPFRHPDLAERFGIRPGGGVLLYGPPGTGKTLLARAVAGEIDATFFSVSAADLLSKWVGEAEQNVKALFDAASAEQRAVIFLDEIEALVPTRRDDGGGGGVMQRVVPQILQGMEGFARRPDRAVLFLGATNVPWQLDAAVLRPGRFDEKVYVPLPDLAARRRLLDLYLAPRPLSPDVDLDAFAAELDGHSGADIKHLCDRAATIPFLQSVAGDSGDAPAEITPAVLDAALADARPSVSPEAVGRYEAWG